MMKPDGFREGLDAHVKTGGVTGVITHQQGPQEGPDEVQEAAEDRRNWWIRVAQCFFDAG